VASGYLSGRRLPRSEGSLPCLSRRQNAATSSPISLSASKRWGGIFDPAGLKHTVDRLNNLSLAEGFWDDPKAAQKSMRERATAAETLELYEHLARDIADLGELLELAEADDDEEMLAEALEQAPALAEGVRALELKRMLTDDDNKDAILSVNSGAGGTDAEDWADMLLRMYLRYADRHGFKSELIEKTAGAEAGISSAAVSIKGPYAYGFLRAEHGVHRLIRISKFSGRRETSFAAVKVVPDLDDVEVAESEIAVPPEDVKITTMRSGGAGGQHVNRTESAVRLEHLPTGFIVRCDGERSQHQNRANAYKMLRGFLFDKARRDKEAAFADAFLSGQQDIGFGRQDRTYTMNPYTMVKDERTDHKEANVDAVLDGDIDAFIEAYLLASADKRREKEEAKKNEE